MLASRIYPYYGPGAACRQAGYIVDQVQNTDKLYVLWTRGSKHAASWIYYGPGAACRQAECTVDQGQNAGKLYSLWTRGDKRDLTLSRVGLQYQLMGPGVTCCYTQIYFTVEQGWHAGSDVDKGWQDCDAVLLHIV